MSMPKFSITEIQPTGRYYEHEGTNYGYPFAEVEILNKPITPRENFRRFMERKDYCWVPNLAVDFNSFFCTQNPDCQAMTFEGGKDSFGVPWVAVEHNEALPALVMPGNPMLKDICDWRNLPFPDPSKWDWEGAEQQFAHVKRDDRANYCFLPEAYFERLITLMDFNNAAMALVTDPEETAAFMERLTDLYIEILRHYKERFDVDLVFISDDWGTQRSPMFSADTCREVIAPAYRRFVHAAHEMGVYTMTHSCGVMGGLVDVITELETDMWQPQIELNPMDEIIDDYGDRLFFNSYALIEDREDLDEFRAVNTELARRYLSKDCMFIEYAAWGDNSDEKNRIIYEILRKAATREL